MAEGGDQPSSIQAGSDADITFVCTPCSEEGTREESIQYCPECDEYLCTTCTKYHRKMKATRDHKLVDKEEGSHVSNVLKTTPNVKCQKHPDRDIEMFCSTHDMIYCLMCIATDHRSCSDVTSLSDAAGSTFQPNDIERLQEELVSVKELLVASEKKKRENIALIEEKRSSIQRRVREIEDSVIKHIKALSKKANATVTETYSKVKGELETEISMLSCKQSEVEKAKVELESTNEENQEHRFVQVKLSQKMINDTKHIYTKLVGRISINFAENTGEIRQLLEISSFGKVNEDREATMKMEIKCQKEVELQGGARKMEIKCQKEEEAQGSARKMKMKCQKEEEAQVGAMKMEIKCQKEEEAQGGARKMKMKCQKEEEALDGARKMEIKCEEGEVQGGARKMEIKCQMEVNVRMQNDNRTCYIFDACQLESGVFVLADLSNTKVKLMNSNHKIIHVFDLSAVPTGVCRTDPKGFAVKLYNNVVELLSVNTHFCISKVRSFPIQRGGQFWGLTYTAGTFWVGNISGVDLYNTNGTLMKSIGRDIFSSAVMQMSVFQNSVYVVDLTKGISCLDRDGTKKAEFRDKRLTCTYSVCISGDGTVYSHDRTSKKIVMFSRDGKCLGELVPKLPDRCNPESLCFDGKNDCILIGYDLSDVITVLYLGS